ncbi:MAG: sigma-54-dependent Fis family transcriptional regulator [Desulfobacteraceae bacterium]|nr:sigma-54-dependent Fis family transcriptional regulator [Desulfobacteraceae bacterium]MBC2719821.1 sigma-54-dependent Fis family transcriptional regulator [Desulfobacteraceae bacterium]
MAMDKVLVVDDEPEIREFISKILSCDGFDVVTASDGLACLEMAKKEDFSVVIVDLKMPGLPGLETIQYLKEIHPDTELIVFTGYPSLESCVETVHKQIFDYICKPDMAALQRAVQHAAERRRLIIANRELMRKLEIEHNRLRQEVTAAKRVIERRLNESRVLVGKTEQIKQIRHFVAQVAPSDMTVLILGESGTGKDVVAKLIHESSGRDLKAWVKINCPAIPGTLLESELFGYESGAFTGAQGQKLGLFELASGGTVFLDEIGDIPLALQGKLLQVIEQKSFTRVGGSKTIEVDVRIIAATNAPIEKMVAEGRFRPDIFYRIKEYLIEMPPLRRRSEDIPLLVQHFLDLYGDKYDHPDLKISREALSVFVQYQWPGNVRELESAIRRIALDTNEKSVIKALKAPGNVKNTSHPVAEAVRATEVQAILGALSDAGWNRRKAAQTLGISYSSLRRRIGKYHLTK